VLVHWASDVHAVASVVLYTAPSLHVVLEPPNFTTYSSAAAR
jgi:hypothetical protein